MGGEFPAMGWGACHRVSARCSHPDRSAGGPARGRATKARHVPTRIRPRRGSGRACHTRLPAPPQLIRDHGGAAVWWRAEPQLPSPAAPVDIVSRIASNTTPCIADLIPHRGAHAVVSLGVSLAVTVRPGLRFLDGELGLLAVQSALRSRGRRALLGSLGARAASNSAVMAKHVEQQLGP